MQTSPHPSRALAPWLALGMFLAALLLPAAAGANYVYWTNKGGTTIGRAKINGGGTNNSFITTTASPATDDPHGIAIDSNFIYWSQGNDMTGSIGRALLNGSGASTLVPHAAGPTSPNGVAVDSQYLYYANGKQFIGRVNLASAAVENHLVDIGAADDLCGVAVDGQFVYWVDATTGAIGRGSLASVAAEPNFIPAAGATCGVAVDSQFVYWGRAGSIGRASINGGAANLNFTINASSVPTCGVSVTSANVFWGNPSGPPGFIGRSTLSGGSANPQFISGATTPCGVAAAPSNKITYQGTTRNENKGTAKIQAKVPGPGSVTMFGGKKVKFVALTLDKNGSFTLPVKPKGKANHQLKKKGSTKVNVTITYTPAGIAGIANPDQKSVSLVKRKKH